MKLPEGAYLYQFIEKQDVPNASDEEWELFVEEYQGAFADAASEIALEMWADFADDERKNKEFQQEWKAILKKDAKQSKLPVELIEGATVATRPLKDWFKPNPKKTIIPKVDDSQQTSLEDFN